MWVNEMYKRASPGPFVSVRDDVATSLSPTPRRFKTRKPCVSCNGWMNQTFEIPTADLLKLMMEHAQRVTLESADQELVARWVVKTTMMLRLTHQHRPQYPTREYRRLRETGAIGPSWKVWIGAQTFPNKRQSHHNLAAKSPVSIPRTFAPYINGMTQSIGHLVMQVLYKGGRDDWTVQNGAESIGIVKRIWPVSIRPVVWPPRFVLTPNDVRELGRSTVSVE